MDCKLTTWHQNGLFLQTQHRLVQADIAIMSVLCPRYYVKRKSEQAGYCVNVKKIPKTSFFLFIVLKTIFKTINDYDYNDP